MERPPKNKLSFFLSDTSSATSVRTPFLMFDRGDMNYYLTVGKISRGSSLFIRHPVPDKNTVYPNIRAFNPLLLRCKGHFSWKAHLKRISLLKGIDHWWPCSLILSRVCNSVAFSMWSSWWKGIVWGCQELQAVQVLLPWTSLNVNVFLYISPHKDPLDHMLNRIKNW